MNENVNLSKILRDCLKGTKLYSPLFGVVKFEEISEDWNFVCVRKGKDIWTFTYDARFLFGISNSKSAEIMLFPSKYQRDWDKFKVKSNKSKFDPKTFQPFDKVLVRKGDKSYNVWFPDFISLPPNDDDETVLCMTTDDVFIAIPYNEETKHLVSTNKEAPEYYRYWED